MSHWWKYPIADVIPFSLSVYIRFLENFGMAIWPWQWVALAIGAIVLLQTLGAKTNSPPQGLLFLLLGMAWLAVAGLFFYKGYAVLFWAAPYFAILFAAQGLLLLGLAVTGGHRNTRRASPFNTTVAAMLVGISVFGYPLVAWLVLGIHGTIAEVFGLFPDPTTSATLATLAVCRGHTRWIAMIVPIIWCIVQTAMGAALAAPTVVLLPILASLSLFIAFRPGREKPTCA